MPVDKFSISLPDALAADVEWIAREDGLTRSAVIREATVRYIAERKSATYEAERRRRIAAAIEGFDAIAAAWGPDERSGLSYLREIRGEPDDEEAVRPPDASMTPEDVRGSSGDG